MSHRRRLLNLIMGNKATDVCALHHIDLHSGKNNLFYPSAAAAAAKDPSFFSMALERMKRIQPGEPRMSFQSTPPADYPYHRKYGCVALKESKTVFLDFESWGGLIYDDNARCAVTLPTLRARKWFPICLAAAGADAGENRATEDDNIFFVGTGPTTMYPGAGDKDDDHNSRFQFQALIHSKDWHPGLANLNRWRCEELPPPAYVGDAGYDDTATGIGSYGMVGGLVCLSTKGVGTYCFDMLTRTWTKVGDWALPFSGKIEHVPELGVLVGFPTWNWNGDQHVCASLLPCVKTLTPWTLPATIDGRRPELCEASASLTPPDSWESVQETQLVSLGGGKLCAVQFFESKKDACTSCRCEDVDKRFAIFTGLEVGRTGEDDGNGEGAIRVIRHKSKLYMLADGYCDDENIFIASVL
ncbi:unnamed protein product [Urochloa humidicola]